MKYKITEILKQAREDSRQVKNMAYRSLSDKQKIVRGRGRKIEIFSYSGSLLCEVLWTANFYNTKKEIDFAIKKIENRCLEERESITVSLIHEFDLCESLNDYEWCIPFDEFAETIVFKMIREQGSDHITKLYFPNTDPRIEKHNSQCECNYCIKN